MMLKDFLKDDFSSCSSNGFHSYPRSITVRFLLEIDMKRAIESKKTNRVVPSSSSLNSKNSNSIAISALQRASVAVINAVKQFPFHSVNSPLFFPTRFSKKLFKGRRFRKKTENEESPAPLSVPEINRGKSFAELLEEIDTTSLDHSNRQSIDTTSSLSQNDVVQDTSTEQNVTVWRNEEKEQLSPVSILDCPFRDEDEISSLISTLIFLPSKEQEIKPFEKRIEEFLSEDESSSSKSMELLKIFKATISINKMKFKPDNLLQDFFQEKIEENEGKTKVLKEAEKWANGNGEKMIVEWEIKGGRKSYVKDMEKGFWAKLEDQNQEMGLQLEFEVFTSLVDEVLFDFLD